MKHNISRSDVRGVLVVTAVLACLAAPVLVAQTLTARYVWVGQLVSIDAGVKAVTMRVPVEPHVARYFDRFKAGDRVVMYWASSRLGETDAIRYVGTHDMTATRRPDDYGYVLPVEFVSGDMGSNRVTFKAYLDAQAFGRFSSIRPEQWVRVTSPCDQPGRGMLAVTDARITEAPEAPAPVEPKAPEESKEPEEGKASESEPPPAGAQ